MSLRMWLFSTGQWSSQSPLKFSLSLFLPFIVAIFGLFCSFICWNVLFMMITCIWLWLPSSDQRFEMQQHRFGTLQGKVAAVWPMAAYQSRCNWDDTTSHLVALVWTGRFSELSICTLMGMSQAHQKGLVCQGLVIEPMGVSCCVWHCDVCSG